MDEGAERNIALFGERMRVFRESLGLTQDQLAKALGGTKRGIQDNEWDKAAPNSKILLGLARLGMNVNWLLLGEGPMLLSNLSGASADLTLFAEAMEVIDLYLVKTKKTMTPANKRKAVEALYKLSIEKNRIDPAVIEMFMQLAA